MGIEIGVTVTCGVGVGRLVGHPWLRAVFHTFRYLGEYDCQTHLTEHL